MAGVDVISFRHNCVMEILRLDDAKSPGDETWMEALVRFERLCHVDVLEYRHDGDVVVVNFSSAYDEQQVYEVRARRSAEELLTYEKKYGVKVPPPLRKLLCEHGPFVIYWYTVNLQCRWGEREFLGFYTSDEPARYPNLMPLTKAIEFNGMRHFVDECFTTEQVTQLDQRYFAFGSLSDDDHSRTYLLFDTAGRFGTLYFHTENYPESQSALLRLLETEFNETNFDQFMVKQIDCAIDYLLRYNEVLISD